MNHVFGSNLFSDRDPDQNMVQMNSMVMSLISTSSFCDCQSQPLRSMFGDFVTKARFSVENTFDKYLSAAPIELVPTRVFERFLQERSYMDTLTYRAEVPEGLKVTYMEYLDVLTPAQVRANNIIVHVIDPYTKFVGSLVTDPVFRNQVSHKVKEFEVLETEYQRTVKQIGECFAKNDYRASAPFGDVVKRRADWQDVFGAAQSLKKLYQAFPAKELTSKLNRLYETLDALTGMINTGGFDNVEKDVTQLLSVGMYHVAKEVELAALTTFRSKTFLEVLNKTVLNIEKIQNSKNDPGDHEYR